VRSTGPIKVLIVEAAALVRSVLTVVLGRDSEIKVVGSARDAYEAREQILTHRPDVILLGVNLPRISGLDFLRKLQVHYPVPVIICGDPTPAGQEAAMRALELGAVAAVAKPGRTTPTSLRDMGRDLVSRIIEAAASRSAVASPARHALPAAFRSTGLNPNLYVVVLGASTGGTQAIQEVLSAAPGDFPPIAIVQHMPAAFTGSFARHLDAASDLAVSLAIDHQPLHVGRAVIATGRQMKVVETAGVVRIRYGDSELVNRHCPSVDVLFESAARIRSRRLIGVLLTGMGGDGAQGLLRLRQAGALTIAQDCESCVVYGMPKVAVDLGAVQFQCSPAEVPSTIIQALRSGRARSPALANDTTGLGAATQ